MALELLVGKWKMCCSVGVSDWSMEFGYTRLGCNTTTEVIRKVEAKVKCMKLLVEVQSIMTTNYIDTAVYLCYIGSCHG